MDVIMDLVLDLVAEVLRWVWPLIGDFWFVILVYLGYKLFGKQGKKQTTRQPGRNLTPVETGGVPPHGQPHPHPRRVRASSRHEPVAPIESVAREVSDAAYERAAADESSPKRAVPSQGGEPASVLPETAKPKLDPREGMKWALIFGPPRAKSPYASSLARRKE